jgi:hypothetical protein
VVVRAFFVFAVLTSPCFLLTLNRLHRKRADRPFSADLQYLPYYGDFYGDRKQVTGVRSIVGLQERQGVSFVDSAAA